MKKLDMLPLEQEKEILPLPMLPIKTVSVIIVSKEITSMKIGKEKINLII